ncbi:N-acetylmuramoyl-L-alanine amidase [Tenacibaculum adriaticum]|uniref:N-acetylmuramoyl-L-alanine amidase n=1 Tax=Tenacibaculum adriaticum TaxID=413713 RepID=A0A5S5DZP0_9FLAO|nr:N-acetylmuramoyl-L-alanine amidase [Tenacibaculum adriaticum]TYQ00213.1 N-acetylmuramoyl-L-alanine amidase [Tenacibaculum adriaticum]
MIFGQKKVVVIDPGHGGMDSGTIGINGLLEKDVVLNVTKEILKLNRVFFKEELDIYVTRSTDTLISLSDRNKLAKGLNADVFVSLHCNASQTFSRGIEVYVHNSDRENTKTSIGLGLSILDEATKELRLKKRGIKFNNFQVLREANNYPAVLVELGFMTNTDEADYFAKIKNVRAVSLSILLGIINHLKLGL